MQMCLFAVQVGKKKLLGSSNKQQHQRHDAACNESSFHVSKRLSVRNQSVHCAAQYSAAVAAAAAFYANTTGLPCLSLLAAASYCVCCGALVK
jgi:hypothetical protein